MDLLYLVVPVKNTGCLWTTAMFCRNTVSGICCIFTPSIAIDPLEIDAPSCSNPNVNTVLSLVPQIATCIYNLAGQILLFLAISDI